MTIKDIAQECAVSVATVSRALSGSGLVRPDTKQRIIEYAASIGYKATPAKKTTPKIMIISGDINNPFYSGIITGATKRLSEEGYKVGVFYSDETPSVEEDYLRFAFEDHYAGVLMITASETEELLAILNKKPDIPIVLANRYLRSMDLDVVCIDNFRGGYIATTQLIDAGHKKIAHLAGPTNSTASQDRLMGFKNALEDFGLSCKPESVYIGNLRKSSGDDFANYYMEHLRDYTAVFCANDICAVSLAKSLTKKGIRIPEDLSIICFDDSTSFISDSIELTSVSRDPLPMGESAAELMLEAMNRENHLPRKVVFPPVLNQRNSIKQLD